MHLLKSINRTKNIYQDIREFYKFNALDNGFILLHPFSAVSSMKNFQTLISAFIFGSYAKGSQRDESDIDVALVIDDLSDNDRFDTQVRLMLLAAKVDNRIEPHPISKKDLNSNNPFSIEIRKTGIELKVKLPQRRHN